MKTLICERRNRASTAAQRRLGLHHAVSRAPAIEGALRRKSEVRQFAGALEMEVREAGKEDRQKTIG